MYMCGLWDRYVFPCFSREMGMNTHTDRQADRQTDRQTDCTEIPQTLDRPGSIVHRPSSIYFF